MHTLSGVFFEMGAEDTNTPALDFQPPVAADWQVELADLIALGQIGIVIILPVPFGEPGDFAIERNGRFQRQLEGLAIDDRQRAGHADAYRAGLRVRRLAERRAAPAEHLALGEQLHVNFKADDDGVGSGHGEGLGIRD